MKSRFGETLKSLRESRHLTQAELANKIFVSDKTISKWEKGKSIPELDLLISLTEVFDVTLDYLLTGKSNKSENKGCKAVYKKDGTVDHYVGEDGDRLFTRNEVSIIVKSRIDRYKMALVYSNGYSSIEELEKALKIYNEIVSQIKIRILNNSRKDYEE